jgi:hypothetical protein
MSTFVWNLHGFQIVDAIPKREMFTAAYHVRNIVTEIVSFPGVEWRER